MKKTALALFFLLTGETVAEPVQIDVPKADCLRLLMESTDYISGISVTGQEVAPADLSGVTDTALPDLENMTLPVYLNLERDFPFWDSKTEMGFLPLVQVEIKNGQVFVNGRLLSENSTVSLKKGCEASLKKAKSRQK